MALESGRENYALKNEYVWLAFDRVVGRGNSWAFTAARASRKDLQTATHEIKGREKVLIKMSLKD